MKFTIRLIALLLAIASLLALSGCKKKPEPAPASSEAVSSEKASEEASEPSDPTSERQPIEYDDYNETVLCVNWISGANGDTFTFVNNSSEAFTFSRDWSVEKKEGNKWYTLEPKEPHMVTADVLPLPSFGEASDSFSPDYYEFVSGERYRIVKRFISECGRTVFAGAEFGGIPGNYELDILAPMDAQPDDPAFVLTDGALSLRLLAETTRYWMKQNCTAQLYYADLATTGDHAGVYSMYDALGNAPTVGESENGVVIEVPLIGWSGVPAADHTYDLCLEIIDAGNGTLYDIYKARVTIGEADVALFASASDQPVDIDPPIVAYKPALYLYPEEEADVTVEVTFPDGEMTVCWPPYGEGWRVTAAPDGTLRDADGHEYPYLYWEAALGDFTPDFSRGFCIPGSETGAFLHDTLSAMGLTPEEYTDFIVYWLPQMQENAYNVISFQQESYTDTTSLTITPAPDSLLRVHVSYYASAAPVEIAPQEIAPFERTGFTAVEWGGSIVG